MMNILADILATTRKFCNAFYKINHLLIIFRNSKGKTDQKFNFLLPGITVWHSPGNSRG